MKTLFLATLMAVSLVRASIGAEAMSASPAIENSDPFTREILAADEARVAAMTTGDRAELNAIFSDALHYGHSNGSVDDKNSLVEKLATRRTVYESMKYLDRTFVPVADDVALMHGRVIANISNGPQKIVLNLKFLAVWRKEAGKWRFLAWQSTKAEP
jgi:Domain of unknown function (DUF4440)